MNEPPVSQGSSRLGRVTLTLNPWLQIFLTIIAGTIVAVIAWTVIGRFLHILILLLASFLVAYLLGPLVDRLSRGRLPRILSILLVYLVILGVVGVGVVLLVGPLTGQLQSLSTALPTLADSNSGLVVGIDRFFREQGIPVHVTDLRNNIMGYITGAGTQLLGGTLAVVAGLVTFVTDLLLILAITFYLLLDGRSMHNRALRLLPAPTRDRWFFIEATLNRVVGGYIRGQLVVALTVGLAAGLGSFFLGVHYPLVIGLLAFLFEFVPMLGPVLGMVPAVVIALFQSPSLALWTAVYFIVLQQVESNVIVPRVSGHAVGLHPLAALLALLAGFELGGVGGALLAVPIAGVIYVILLAIYSDVTGPTELLVQPKRTAYDTAYNSLRKVIRRRREPALGTNKVDPSDRTPRVAPGAAGAAGEAGKTAISQAAATSAPVGAAASPAANDRLASIAHEQAQLIARFEADEKEQAATDQAASDNAALTAASAGPGAPSPAGEAK